VRGLAAVLVAGLALPGRAVGDDDAPPAGPAPAPAAAPAPALDPSLSLVSLSRRVRTSVLPVEVHSPSGRTTRRQAVVVDPEGWLVLAGSTPSPHDRLTVLLPTETGSRSAQALVVGSDAASALTLLQLVSPPSDLAPLALPRVEERRPLPPPPALTAIVVMVSADGSVARGRVRSLERRRVLVDGAAGTTREATGLIEAALATVASDLGAPWVDEQGALVGLLAGGVVEELEGGEPSPPDVVVRAEPVAAHAVPAGVVALVWPLLRTHQSVPRAKLGVKVRAASDALRKHVCAGCGGQEVTELVPGGPAALGGIEIADLIVAVDGASLPPGAAMADVLLPYRPLDRVTVTVVRRGERLEKRVLLAAR
jgi:S1-C subfamily serine protease